MALGSVSLIPVAITVLIWAALPKSPELSLNAEIVVGPGTWPPGDSPAAKLMPCVMLRNPTDDQWENVSLTLNGQFFYYHPQPISGRGSLVIPLKHFVTKGHQAFVPDYHPLKELTTYAPIPSGARAVRDVRF